MAENRATYFKKFIQKKSINSWFELGLFLDRLKEDQNKTIKVPPSFSSFMKNVSDGVAFISFSYGIDGVSIEIEKYSRVLDEIFKEKIQSRPKIHWIGDGENIPQNKWNFHKIEGLMGFDKWDGFEQYFKNSLVRGSKDYNELFEKIWSQTVSISIKLAELVSKKNIQLLIPVNVNSNPGNIPLAFAVVLVSEILNIPVLNSCHDFYWEEGDQFLNKNRVRSPGVRDLFFSNYHLGELFALLEMLYPWDSPKWFNAVINDQQEDTLIKKFAINPNSAGIIPTFIDIETYHPRPHKTKIAILKKLKMIFSGSQKKAQSVSIDEILISLKKDEEPKTPIIIGRETGNTIHFDHSNLIVLQPTRIVRRKQIEWNFKFLKKLAENKSFINFLKENKKVIITILVTGPIATGQYLYFKELIFKFEQFLKSVSSVIKDRIFLGLKFGVDRNSYMTSSEIPSLGIAELFSVASLVVLPSKTEGRGLPILEAAASGVPLLVNRYDPMEVYSSLIGEGLQDSMCLKVFEISREMVNFSDDFLNLFINDKSFNDYKEHNRLVVEKRFSMKILETTFEKFLFRLWTRWQKFSRVEKKDVVAVFEKHHSVTNYGKGFKSITCNQNRKYIPGYTQLEYMNILKSLIDPSSFRMEEKAIKGRVLAYALKIIKSHKKIAKIDSTDLICFFKKIDFLFNYHVGNEELVVDHSFSYRYRHSLHYPYRKITEYELIGLVAQLFRETIGEIKSMPFSPNSFGIIFKNRYTLADLLDGRTPVINDSKRLDDDLKSSKSFVWLPGNNFSLEAMILVVQTVKERLGLKVNEDLTKKKLLKIKNIGNVYLVVRKQSIGTPVFYDNIIKFIKTSDDVELQNIYKSGFLRIVPAEFISNGSHLGQLGKKALTIFQKVKNENGFIVSFGDANYMMLDKVDLTSYRIGTVRHILFQHLSGLNNLDSYIQWVPPGLSTSLAYPTPIQSPLDFYTTLQGNLYKSCVKKYGEKYVLDNLRSDAVENNSPIKTVLELLLNRDNKTLSAGTSNILQSVMLTGLHKDGLPYSGAKVKVNPIVAKKNKKDLQFHTMFSSANNSTVFDLIKTFENKEKKAVSFGWNGGYMLNPELVGKLGISEDYVGSPLGLVIIDGKVLSLPLYNKPAFCITKTGKLLIKSVNMLNGLTIGVKKGSLFEFSNRSRNALNFKGAIFYDLLFPQKSIEAKGRIIYRLAGNKIIAVVSGESSVDILPVGVTVSIPEQIAPVDWTVGKQVVYSLSEYSDIQHAIEAGPLLVDNSKISINMKKEGWKTNFSIATQAARMDYTHLRGPKIGVGLLKGGELIVVAINGRIRESVGSTHEELARILVEQGAVRGMGFDPGGSVTLIVNGKQLNISPYNIDYEKSPYSMPPQPRRIGNAILGTIE